MNMIKDVDKCWYIYRKRESLQYKQFSNRKNVRSELFSKHLQLNLMNITFIHAFLIINSLANFFVGNDLL